VRSECTLFTPLIVPMACLSCFSVVVIAGIFGSLNGYHSLDSIAAIVVGLMVIYIAWELGTNATKELVDTQYLKAM
jgi:divalent metal cation (Fe/Co/Zn/Cd) transporter